MKRLLALLLCLVMVVSVVAGCGKKDDDDKGAVIRTYMTSKIYNLDPIYAYIDDAATKIMGMVYEGLFTLNANGKVEKALCKDYKIIEDEDLDLFMLLITDIVNSNSQVIALGKEAALVEKAYDVKLEDNTVLLEGVVSRKKQVVPIMTENA